MTEAAPEEGRPEEEPRWADTDYRTCEGMEAGLDEVD